jgi:hypothetical protein
MKNPKEITEMIGRVDLEAQQYFGMSYEEGVLAALDWVIGNTNDPPIDK